MKDTLDANKLPKCKGCGVYLSLNKDDLGFVPKFDKKTKYCFRCFQLKHYNKNVINFNHNELNKKIDSINNDLDFKNKNVFLILDVLDIYATKIKIDQNYKQLILIINKMDLFKHLQNDYLIKERIIKNLKDLKYKFNKIFFTSIDNTTSIKKLNFFINHLQKNSTNIFVGNSNVGKSSLINRLLTMNHQEPSLICCNSFNTTINLQKIKLNYQYIIDTPGIVNQNSILNYIDNKTNKLYFNDHNVNIRTYQIKYNKCLLIENLVAIEVELEQKTLGSISFYLNKHLKILTKKSLLPNMCDFGLIFNQKNCINYLDEKTNTFVKKEFIFDNQKANISICGLGLIAIKNIKRINIYILDKVAINQWKYWIV